MRCILYNLNRVSLSRDPTSQLRRLRVQQRIKSADSSLKRTEESEEMLDIPSTIPFLPNMVIIPSLSSFYLHIKMSIVILFYWLI